MEDSCACVSTGSGLRRCAYRRTRTLGGSRWRHYLCSLLGVHWFPLKCGRKTVEWYGKQVCHTFGRSYYSDDMVCVLALVRLPSLHGYYAGMVYWENGALRGDYRHILCKTFSPATLERFWEQVLWHLWIGWAWKPGLAPPQHVAVEVFDDGGWLTHWDLALETEVDYHDVVEPSGRLLPRIPFML